MTRYVFERVRENTNELVAFRADTVLRLERMVADMALVKATQIAQGGTLNILVQDVRELRTEMGAMRADMRELRAELRTEIGEMRTGLHAEVGELRTGLRTEVNELRTGLRAEVGELRTEIGDLRTEMNRRFSTIEQSLAMLVAAVSPRSPV